MSSGLDPAEDKGRALHAAAMRGDTATVNTLLDQGVLVDSLDTDGRTPLMAAVRYGHSSVVCLLLDRGATIDAMSKYGTGELRKTALRHAVECNRVEIVPLLVERGADLADPHFSRASLLTDAVRLGHYEMVKVLLDCGADPNPPDNKALSEAVDRKDERLVRFLLERGTDINTIAPLMYNYDGWTALMQATSAMMVEMVTLLIEAGADVNVTSPTRGSTALSHAYEWRSSLLVTKAEMEAKAELASGDSQAKEVNYLERIVEVQNDLDTIINLLYRAGAKG